MMYFVQTHHLQAKNRLQEAIIKIVDGWNCVLLDDEEAKKSFIDRMRKNVGNLNDQNPKCKPCFMTGLNDVFTIKPDGEENAFATFVVLKVKATYDGITRWKETGGGAE